MSFSCTNPNYYLPQYGNYRIMPQMQQYNPQIPYAQNPYQASFYTQNNIYPYNPLFSPQTSKDYVKIGETTAPNGDKTYLYRLNNGHTISIVPRENQATYVKTIINAGSLNETDEDRGIQHTMEHGAFLGSDKLKNGDVFKKTGKMGAYTNASTDYAKVDYYISAPFMGEKELEETIKIQGDMVYNPSYDKDAVESEKEPICSEISMMNDNPMTVAYDRLIRNLFQINSTSKNLVAGSIDTVRNITGENMFKYHNTYYSPENLYTTILMDKNTDVDKVAQMAADSFKASHNWEHKGERYNETLNPIQQSKRVDIVSPKTSYTSVLIGFSGPRPADKKDFLIEKMLGYYLNNCSTSDLKNNLEEINGNSGSEIQKVGLEKTDPYALVNVLELNPKDEQKGLDIFYDAISKLQTQPLSDDDMCALQNYVEKDIEIMTLDSESLGDFLGGCMVNDNLDLYANCREIAKSITKEDIMNFARKYYDLNKASIVVVHPQEVSTDEIMANYANSKYNLSSARNVSFTSNLPPKTDTNIKELILQNNTHLALNNSDSSLCAFNWSVNTPPIKPKNPNIPAVLMYMFTKGSEYKNQSELERYKELNGIDASVYVNGRSIEISADCMEENVPRALALLNELMYHPKLTRGDFEAGKKHVKDYLLTSQKDAEENLLDNLYPGYFPKTSEMLKTIDELCYEDIVEFYNQLLRSASSTFVASMPIEKNQNLSKEVVNYQSAGDITFQDSTPKLAPMFQANQESNVIYDIDDLNQACIYKSYKFPLSGNIKDELEFELTNEILGGSSNARLFSDLREKENLAYSVSSHIKSFENTGILTLSIQTTTDDKEAGVISYDNVQKSLEGFNKHINLLCSEYVTDEELESAKETLKQQIIGQCQNPLSKTDLLAMNIKEPYGIKRIDKYLETIDKITKEDIKRAANFMFSFKPTTSILSSEDTINSQMEYLKTQGVIQKAV